MLGGETQKLFFSLCKPRRCFLSPLEQPGTTASGTVPPLPTSTPSSFFREHVDFFTLLLGKGATFTWRALGAPEKN